MMPPVSRWGQALARDVRTRDSSQSSPPANLVPDDTPPAGKPVQVRCAKCGFLLWFANVSYLEGRRLNTAERERRLTRSADGRATFSCPCGAKPVRNMDRLEQVAREAARRGIQKVSI